MNLKGLITDLRKLNPGMVFSEVDIDGNGYHYGVGYGRGDLGAIQWPEGFRVSSNMQLTSDDGHQTYDLYQIIPIKP